MIASLKGVVLIKDPGEVIVDVQGVGYAVFISSRTFDQLPEVGDECFLFIHTSVREDAITLYGFDTQEVKALFLLIIGVSGIGPKLALAILSGLGVDELSNAIRLEDYARLTSIAGVGKKTAQRLCVELAEKVGSLAGYSDPGNNQPASVGNAPVPPGNAVQDAVSALVNLGYPQHQAWKAVRSVPQTDEQQQALPVEELIRLALQAMA